MKIVEDQLEVLKYADYYPLGWEMPGRTYTSTAHPNNFGYQGEYSRKNDQFNWNEFQLRNYDARIGRWTTIDPAGQYFSPYMAMGNNPMSIVDPDGAWGYYNEKYGYIWIDNIKGYEQINIDGVVYDLIASTVIEFARLSGNSNFKVYKFENHITYEGDDGLVPFVMSDVGLRELTADEINFDKEDLRIPAVGAPSELLDAVSVGPMGKISKARKLFKGSTYRKLFRDTKRSFGNLKRVWKRFWNWRKLRKAKSVSEESVSNIVSKNIRDQKQAAEHTIGGKRLGTNSYLNSVDDAKSVLNATHNGEAKILSTTASQNRVYIQYDGVKGYYNNNGTIIETNRFLIKGLEKKATVVPIHPNSSKFK